MIVPWKVIRSNH